MAINRTTFYWLGMLKVQNLTNHTLSNTAIHAAMYRCVQLWLRNMKSKPHRYFDLRDTPTEHSTR